MVSSTDNLYNYGWSEHGHLGHGDFNNYPIPHQAKALKIDPYLRFDNCFTLKFDFSNRYT